MIQIRQSCRDIARLFKMRGQYWGWGGGGADRDSKWRLYTDTWKSVISFGSSRELGFSLRGINFPQSPSISHPWSPAGRCQQPRRWHWWPLGREDPTHSVVASPLCQEGQSERTFPILPFSRFFLFFSIPSFPPFPDFPSFSRLLTIFFLSGALCPPPPHWLPYCLPPPPRQAASHPR